MTRGAAAAARVSQADAAEIQEAVIGLLELLRAKARGEGRLILHARPCTCRPLPDLSPSYDDPRCPMHRIP